MPAQRRDETIASFVEWVADVQQGYGRWVRLPPCWPRHQALAEELLVFWRWRRRIETVPDVLPEEAERWHQYLRAAAQAWADAYGGCRHESVGEVDERRDPRESKLEGAQPHVECLNRYFR